MNRIDDEEMFLMMNPIIALEREMEIGLKVFGCYPDKHECYHGIDLMHRESIDDEWNELITEVFPDVGW